jgi:hypothetical protein
MDEEKANLGLTEQSWPYSSPLLSSPPFQQLHREPSTQSTLSSSTSQITFLPLKRQYTPQMSECLTVLLYVEKMKSPM